MNENFTFMLSTFVQEDSMYTADNISKMTEYLLIREHELFRTDWEEVVEIWEGV